MGRVSLGVCVDQTSQSVNDFNNLTETMSELPFIQHLPLQVLTVGLEINKIVPFSASAAHQEVF